MLYYKAFHKLFVARIDLWFWLAFILNFMCKRCIHLCCKMYKSFLIFFSCFSVFSNNYHRNHFFASAWKWLLHEQVIRHFQIFYSNNILTVVFIWHLFNQTLVSRFKNCDKTVDEVSICDRSYFISCLTQNIEQLFWNKKHVRRCFNSEVLLKLSDTLSKQTRYRKLL